LASYDSFSTVVSGFSRFSGRKPLKFMNGASGLMQNVVPNMIGKIPFNP